MAAAKRIRNGKTQGPKPALVQYVILAVSSWLLARYAVDLDAETSFAISQILGAGGAVAAPTGEVVSRR